MGEGHKQPVPKLGESCYLDMISESTSPEAKANAARRYSEMMIDLFLSEKAKERLGESSFKKLSLGEQIREVQNDFSLDIVNTLFEIKNIGDQGSHYSQQPLSMENAIRITNSALGLFTLILIDYFKKTGLNKTFNTAKIFSTLFPKIRADVLSQLLNKGIITTEYDIAILHKYILALVKNGQKNKAKNLLRKKYEKGLIEEDVYYLEIKVIQTISEGIEKNELPVPLTINDCKRNFDSVINSLDDYDRNENYELIKIISTLLNEINPSELGTFIPNKEYLIYNFLNEQ
ncbi:hypothetical protein [Lysinibacillus xylanilyticus]|uniref:hypothetical protein n=1 Tax=Lysinibacillus xylanilyticus TaxID=582475 RepID=UPI003D955826